MQSLLRVLRSASALWPYYLAVVIISSGVAALGLVSPFIIREATDTIVGYVSGGSEGSSPVRIVVWLAIALFAAESAAALL